MRIGIGYDVHRLVDNRALILGGVPVPHKKGLEGHSDADVLVHAIMDAILGACAMGDIGRHFPDTDDAYLNISSLKLLRMIGKKIEANGYQIINIDSTIVAQSPKLAPYIDEMVTRISDTLGIDPARVNVKATTTEHLGFEGREEAISAQAVASVFRSVQMP